MGPAESDLILTMARTSSEAGAGIGGTGNWPAMLAALAAHLQADAAELRLAGAGWNMAGPIERPLPPVLAGLRPGRVYTGEELADRMLYAGNPRPGDSGASTSWPDDPLAQAADCRAIGLRLPEEGDAGMSGGMSGGEAIGRGMLGGGAIGGGVGWLLFTRRRGGFRAVDSAALSVLAPHVAQALNLAARIDRLQTRARQAEDLLRRIGIGCLHWDRHGRPVARDAVARAFLDRLSPEAPLSDTRSRGLPERLPERLAEPPAGTGYRRLSAEIEMLVATEDGGRRIGILRACNRPLPDPATLARALDLSPAQARLAHALAQGDSLHQAAARLGVTVETARFYSRQIYARTGLRGQPDLMRRIWAGALGLGRVDRDAAPQGDAQAGETPNWRRQPADPAGPAR